MRPTASISEVVQIFEPTMVAVRRQLHENPEVGLHLPLTQQVVAEVLRGAGIEYSFGEQLSSIVAVVRGTKAVSGVASVSSVLLRGDMDALPITEDVNNMPRSQVPGVMHACGHDLHTSMLLGAALALTDMSHLFQGEVILMFQPGEEGYDGAQLMLDEGVLDAASSVPSAAWAVHVLSGRVPNGTFSARPGVTMSSSSELHVRFIGAGGHGAAPHTAADPVPALVECISGLQHRVSRVISPFEPTVISVGSVHAGDRANIIPADGRFGATIRTFSEDVMDQIDRSLTTYCEAVARAHGLKAEVDFRRQYPTTVNDESQWNLARRIVTEVFGQSAWQTPDHPSSGSEDFSRILQRVPGALIHLGASTRGSAWRDSAENHSPQSQFDESVMPRGAELLVRLALETLTTSEPDPSLT